MVCLPGVIGSGSVTTNVANNCCVSDYLGGFAIPRVIKDFFLLCCPNVFELLHTLAVDFTAGLGAELSAI